MTDYSSTPGVQELDIRVDGKPVYARELTAGDELALAPTLGKLVNIAGAAKAKEVTEVGEQAAKSMTPEQYEAWVVYQQTVVALRWCDENGKRLYRDRKAMDGIPRKTKDAIHAEMSKLDQPESMEQVEGNS